MTDVVPSDVVLIVRARGGDDAAFEELYRRHADVVRRYARRCCRDAHTAEDLTGEAFTRTLQAVRGGEGPVASVQAYLLTTVRRVAAAWSAGGRLEAPDAEVTESAGPVGAVVDAPAEMRAVVEADKAMILRAFCALPKRWQAVLWHTAVEDEPPRRVALLLGLNANATAVLAHRAREGLRQAYLQAHVNETSAREECRHFASQLGAYTRKTTRLRTFQRLRGHLDRCERCRAAYRELVDLNGALRAIVPLVPAGWLAAAWLGGAGQAAGGAGALAAAETAAAGATTAGASAVSASTLGASAAGASAVSASTLGASAAGASAVGTAATVGAGSALGHTLGQVALTATLALASGTAATVGPAAFLPGEPPRSTATVETAPHNPQSGQATQGGPAGRTAAARTTTVRAPQAAPGGVRGAAHCPPAAGERAKGAGTHTVSGCAVMSQLPGSLPTDVTTQTTGALGPVLPEPRVPAQARPSGHPESSAAHSPKAAEPSHRTTAQTDGNGTGQDDQDTTDVSNDGGDTNGDPGFEERREQPESAEPTGSAEQPEDEPAQEEPPAAEPDTAPQTADEGDLTPEAAEHENPENPENPEHAENPRDEGPENEPGPRPGHHHSPGRRP